MTSDCADAYRVAKKNREWEIWAKDLADGGKAVALFNLSDEDLELGVTGKQLGMTGTVRDLWRQKENGLTGDRFSATVSPRGVVLVKLKP